MNDKSVDPSNEDKCFDAIEQVNETFVRLSDEDITPPMITEAVRLVVGLMNRVIDLPDYQEFDDDLGKLAPEAFAAILMRGLPSPDCRWSLEDKARWLQVAQDLGPDWLEQFRKVGAFMTKVEGF